MPIRKTRKLLGMLVVVRTPHPAFFVNSKVIVLAVLVLRIWCIRLLPSSVLVIMNGGWYLTGFEALSNLLALVGAWRSTPV